MATTTLQAKGLHCSSCSMLITMNLEDLPGIQSVDCNHSTGKTVVVFDEAVIDATRIREAIIESGYDAKLVD